MTTPQNELYRISQSIRDLYDLFEPKNEDEDSIFERVHNIERTVVDIMNSQHRIDSSLYLIIRIMETAK